MDDYDQKILHMINMADDMEDMAEMAMSLGWGTAANSMRSAASSIRWNINWERKNPEYRAAAKVERS